MTLLLRNFFFQCCAIFIIAFVVGFFLYKPTLDDPPHFDDEAHVKIEAIHSVFPLSKFFIYNTEIGVDVPHRGVALVTHALTKAISKEGNYFYFHFFQILFHSINAFLVFVFIFKLLGFFSFNGGKTNDENRTVYLLISLFCFLLFLTHPIQSNVAAYMAQRTSELLVMFSLLSLLFFMTFLSQQGIKRKGAYYALSFISFSFAIFSKENAVTIIPLMFILQLHTGEAELKKMNSKKFLKILLPFLPFALFIIFYSQFASFKTHTMLFDQTPASYFFLQTVVILKYIGLLLYPSPDLLNMDWDIRANTFSIGQIELSLVVNALIFFCGCLFLFLAKLRILGFAIIWFYATISPDSSFMPLSEKMVEYRLYMPAIGFFLFFAMIVWVAVEKIQKKNTLFLYTFIILVITILSIYSTVKRLPVFDTELIYWTDVIKKSPNKARGYATRGSSAYKNMNKIPEALADLNKAIELKSDLGDAYINRGVLLASQGHFHKAIADFKHALEYKKHNTSYVYLNLGAMYFSLYDIENSLASFHKACEMKNKHGCEGFDKLYYALKNSCDVGDTKDCLFLDQAIEKYGKK
ncbi:MAG: hypothetical protein HQK84_04015 [Nitrospinae bacterium]|nr:hypothetical protein [Nitrospinota bacterium]